MAWTKGIKHRRNTKSTLILDPPSEGEIVYAIDTGEWGTLLKNGKIGWSFIFNNDGGGVGLGGGTAGTQMHRFTNTEITNIVEVPAGMVINALTILIVDGIAQKPATYNIIDRGVQFSFELNNTLTGKEDIIIQNGMPVSTYSGDVTIDLSGGITLPTWKGVAQDNFLPFFRLYNNLIFTLTGNLFLENPVVGPTGHYGKLIFKDPGTITFDTMYDFQGQPRTINVTTKVVVLDYIFISPSEIIVTRVA